MRIIDKLIDYIENHSDVTITDVDSFYSDDSERVMLMQDPSTAVETRYMDGSRTGEFSYSVYAKSKNSQTAVAILFELENVLDIPGGLKLNDVEVLKNEVVQSAHFVSKTAENEKIYVSTFTLSYYYGG